MSGRCLTAIEAGAVARFDVTLGPVPTIALAIHTLSSAIECDVARVGAARFYKAGSRCLLCAY